MSAKHRRVSPAWKFLRWGLVLTMLAVSGGAALLSMFDFGTYQLNGNITAVDTAPLLGTDRPVAVVTHPDAPKQPLNILIVGSDSRKGTKIGGSTPGLSDTTILLHITADRTKVTGVSIPRDSMVQRPDCVGKNGETIPASFGMFNAAFSQGGIACTQRTVEQLTGVRTDHFIVVNLAGFQDMVDAIGGVPICVPQPVNDPIGRIYLKAGSYTANGKQALDYARERHTMSLNGDLGRMKRQQTLLAAIAHKVLSVGMLAHPFDLYHLLDRATSSLTTDPGMATVESLAGLAQELKDIDPHNIRFLSVPTHAYEPDPNRLAWDTEVAEGIWEAFRNDSNMPGPVMRDATRGDRAIPGEGATDHKVRKADTNGLCA